MPEGTPLNPSDVKQQIEGGDAAFFSTPPMMTPETTMEDMGFVGGEGGLGDFADYEQGADIRQIRDDATYLNRLRSSNQSGSDQALNAIAGGFLKMIPTSVMDISYMADPNTYKSLAGVEKAEQNWLSANMDAIKKDVDQNFPIFREDPTDAVDLSDPGFYWGAISSLISESGGMALGGGALGSAVKGISKLGKLGKLAKAEGLASKLIKGAQYATVGTMNNIAEGMYISVEAFNKGVAEDKKIITGIIDQEAEAIAAKYEQYQRGENIAELTIAGTNPDDWYAAEVGRLTEKAKALEKKSLKERGEQSNHIQQLNMAMVFGDMLQLRGILSSGTTFRKEAIRSVGGKLKNAISSAKTAKKAVGNVVLKDMAPEAFEEVYQEGVEKETGYQAQLATGLTKEKSAGERFSDFITSEETWLAAALGAIGGPVQSGAMAAIGDASRSLSSDKAVRAEHNRELEENQAITKTLLDSYISTRAGNEAGNFRAREEALKRGDEAQVTQSMEQSMDDVIYEAMERGTLNTLEESLDDYKNMTETPEGFSDDFKSSVSNMKSRIPAMEARFAKAHKNSLNEEGEPDVVLRKTLAELDSRASIARNISTEAKRNYDNQYRDLVDEHNAKLKSERKRLSTIEQSYQKLQDDKIALNVQQIQLSAQEKESVQKEKELVEESTKLKKDRSKKAKEQSRIAKLNLQAISKEKASIKEQIEDVNGELANVEEQLREQDGGLAGVQAKIKKLSEDPEYKKAQEELKQASEYETAANLYKTTYKELIKPETKQEFSKAQDELLDKVVTSITAEVKAKIDQRERADVIDAMPADEAALQEEPELAETIEETVGLEEFEEFAKKQIPTDERAESIVGKLIKEAPLSTREQAIVDTDPEGFDIRVEQAKELEKAKLEEVKKANTQKASDTILENIEESPEVIVEHAANKGIVEDAEDLVTDTLPSILTGLQEGTVTPPEGITSQEAIDKVSDAISAVKDIVGAGSKVSDEQVQDSVNGLADKVDYVSDNGELVNNEIVDGELNGESRFTHNRRLRHVNAMAYSSNLDSTTGELSDTELKRAKALAAFVEDPATNMADYEVQYEVETDTSKLSEEAKLATEYYANGEELSDQHKQDLALRMYFIDSEGQRVEVNGIEVYGHMHRADYPGYSNDAKTQAEATEFHTNTRLGIVNALLDGKKVYSSVDGQRKGYANNRYTYKFETSKTDERGAKSRVTETVTFNTQDEKEAGDYKRRRQEDKTRSGKPKVTAFMAVKNNLQTVTKGAPVEIAVGQGKGKDMALAAKDGFESLPTSQTKTEGRLYFKVKTANGTPYWAPAYMREMRTEEHNLRAEITEDNAAAMRSKYGEQIAVVDRALGKEATVEEIKAFYTPKPGRNTMQVDVSKLNDPEYVDAITHGEVPIIFSTLHPLDTGARSDMNNFYVQPTVVVSTEYRVDNTKPETKPEVTSGPTTPNSQKGITLMKEGSEDLEVGDSEEALLEGEFTMDQILEMDSKTPSPNLIKAFFTELKKVNQFEPFEFKSSNPTEAVMLKRLGHLNAKTLEEWVQMEDIRRYFFEQNATISAQIAKSGFDTKFDEMKAVVKESFRETLVLHPTVKSMSSSMLLSLGVPYVTGHTDVKLLTQINAAVRELVGDFDSLIDIHPLTLHDGVFNNIAATKGLVVRNATKAFGQEGSGNQNRLVVNNVNFAIGTSGVNSDVTIVYPALVYKGKQLMKWEGNGKDKGAPIYKPFSPKKLTKQDLIDGTFKSETPEKTVDISLVGMSTENVIPSGATQIYKSVPTQEAQAPLNAEVVFQSGSSATVKLVIKNGKLFAQNKRGTPVVAQQLHMKAYVEAMSQANKNKCR